MARQIENKRPAEPGCLVTGLSGLSDTDTDIAHWPPAVPTDIRRCPGSPRCGAQGSHEHHKLGPADAKTYKYLKLAKIASQLHNYYRAINYFGGEQTVIINRLDTKSAPRMGYNN